MERSAKKYVIHLMIIGAILFGVFCSHDILASEIRFNPFVGLNLSYDDNILFRKNDIISDTYFLLRPGLNLTRKTDLLKIRLKGNYDIYKYISEDELDTENVRTYLSGEYNLKERLKLGAEASYLLSTTMDTYLEETGRVVRREDHKLFKNRGRFTYRISEISNLSLQYSFANSEYDNDELSDWDSHVIGVTYTHRLKNEIDSLYISPNYYYRLSDTQDVDDMSLSVGWRRNLSEAFKSNLLVGGRYTTVESNNGSEDSNWGIKAQFQIERKTELSKTTINYFHDLRTTENGGEVNTDNLMLAYERNLMPQFGIGIMGRFVYSYKASDRQQDISNTKYIQVKPYLYYILKKNCSIRLSYRYQYNEEDSHRDDSNIDRNQLWIEFRYSWPMSFQGMV